MKPNSVLIATFSPWINGKRKPNNGMVEPMCYYFTKHAARVTLIDQPYPGSDVILPRIEQYQKNSRYQIRSSGIFTKLLSPFLRIENKPGTRLSFKLRDFVSVIEEGLRTNDPYDLFIGLEAINALAGVILKKLGKVKTVAYYVSDYSPKRYPGIFNSVYLWLDRQACYHTDFIWDVSPAMLPARITAGLEKSKTAPCILVPNALFPKQIHTPRKKTIPFSLVYAGTLGPENGPDLAIDAMPMVLKKFPYTHLHIYGDDQFLPALKQRAKDHGINQAVTFHGTISNQQHLSHAIGAYSLGLAPYRNIPNSPRQYADATKLRLYMGAGLPVITTFVPPLGREIEIFGAGIRTHDNAEDFARTIVAAFAQKTSLTRYIRKAHEYAVSNTWDNTYTQTLKQMNVS